MAGRPGATRTPASAIAPGGGETGGQEAQAICVFCGASPGARAAYAAAAHAVGELLARRSITTIYGGGQVGMMGALAAGALSAGGRVVGVIPEHLMRPEVAHAGLSELLVVDSMHTRKRTMASRSDAFIVLPGGYGTFDELFEMVTWRQLGLQSKPIGILNVDGFFDGLMDFLRHVGDEGFLRNARGELLVVEDDPLRLLQRLQGAVPRTAPQPRDPGVQDLSRS